MMVEPRRERRADGETFFVAVLAAAAYLYLALVLSAIAVAMLGALFSEESAVTAAMPRPAEWPGLLSIFSDPGAPAAAYPDTAATVVPDATGFWVLYIIVLALFAGVGVMIVRAILASRRRPGYATGAQIRRAAGERIVRREGRAVRPNTSKRSRRRMPATELGLYVCDAFPGRIPVYISRELSVLVVGPMGSGKTAGVTVPQVLEAPGAVIATGTKPDLMDTTAPFRRTRGTVHCFDPTQTSTTVPSVRWSLVRGCDDITTARARAAGLAAGASVGKGVQGGDWWEGMTTAILTAYLHAAALGGKGATSLRQWAANPYDDEPIDILASSSQAAPGLDHELREQQTAGESQKGGVWGGVRRALDCLSDPRVAEVVSPSQGEEFDPKSFLDGQNTLYLVGSTAAQVSVAPLISAMIEDILETGKRLAAMSNARRLDPPLTLVLDEVANIAPLPSLPFLLGDGRGYGFTTLPVVQSFAQVRSRWGDDEAEVIWDNCTCKVVLPGLSNPRDLEMMSKLGGQYEAYRPSRTRSGRGGLSVQDGWHDRDVLRPDAIKNLRKGRCLVLLTGIAPVEGRLRMWFRNRTLKRTVGCKPSTRDRLRGLVRDTATDPAVEDREQVKWTTHA